MQDLIQCPFSVVTDGNNERPSKLYPIIVSYHHLGGVHVDCTPLALPNLALAATGENIAALIDSTFKQHKIIWSVLRSVVRMCVS